MQLKKIHIILFLATVATTFLTGLSFGGGVVGAVSFAVALLLILGAHEMGHYVYGKKYGVDITPPYFIPAPPYISPIGTFGAFIKIKSPISTKRALFDIGIAGPLAGIIVAIPVIILGIQMSTIIDVSGGGTQPGFDLGSPLIFTFLSDTFYGTVPEGKDLLLHPVAFAGWVGLFVTALNLIPSGQLDGGHILYALFPSKWHSRVSVSMVILLLIFGTGTRPLLNLVEKYLLNSANVFPSEGLLIFDGWPGWIMWAVLLTFLGTRHPPTSYEDTMLDRNRIILGILALLIFIGCFTPVPISIRA